MHVYSARRDRIELEHLPSSFAYERDMPVVGVRSETASQYVASSARAFFGSPSDW